MPGIAMSRIKHPVCETRFDARNSFADENAQTAKPKALTKPGSDSLTDSSSSITDTSEPAIFLDPIFHPHNRIAESVEVQIQSSVPTPSATADVFRVSPAQLVSCKVAARQQNNWLHLRLFLVPGGYMFARTTKLVNCTMV
jgi:hypothetical protein